MRNLFRRENTQGLGKVNTHISGCFVLTGISGFEKYIYGGYGWMYTWGT